MAERKSRSVFIPLLVVGVIGLVLFATLVPIRTCPLCDGTGSYQPVVEGAPPDFPIEHIRCEGCSPYGKVPILNLWGAETKTPLPPRAGPGEGQHRLVQGSMPVFFRV